MRTQSHNTRRISHCKSSPYNSDDGNVTDAGAGADEGTTSPQRNSAMHRRKLHRRFQGNRRRASNDGQMSRASISSRRRESSSISLSISLVSSNDSASFLFHSERSTRESLASASPTSPSRSPSRSPQKQKPGWKKAFAKFPRRSSAAKAQQQQQQQLDATEVTEEPSLQLSTLQEIQLASSSSSLSPVALPKSKLRYRKRKSILKPLTSILKGGFNHRKRETSTAVKPTDSSRTTLKSSSTTIRFSDLDNPTTRSAWETSCQSRGPPCMARRKSSMCSVELSKAIVDMYGAGEGSNHTKLDSDLGDSLPQHRSAWETKEARNSILSKMPPFMARRKSSMCMVEDLNNDRTPAAVGMNGPGAVPVPPVASRPAAARCA